MTGSFPSCDGIRRRDLLKIGVASTFGFSLSLPTLLQRRAAATQTDAARGTRLGREVSLLIIYLQGGMSTIDVFDLKPEAPPEFRGDFRPIDTNAAGLQIASICLLSPGREINSRSCDLSRITTRDRVGRSLHAHRL